MEIQIRVHSPWLILLFFFGYQTLGTPIVCAESKIVKKKRKKKRSNSQMNVQVAASVEGKSGGFSGDTTRRQSGAFEAIHARIRPQVEYTDWRLQVPVSVSDKRTAFANQDESVGSVGVRLRYKKSRKLALTFRSNVSGRWRSEWDDQYQPMVDGGLGVTDRYSRWTRDLGVEATSVLAKKYHSKISYKYEVFDYREDPNFDPFDAPTHIVPGDRNVHAAKLKIMRWNGKTKLGGGIDVSRQKSLFAFARDAGDGKTHALPGGLPPNPLEVLISGEPYVAWEYGRLKDTWQLDLHYGVVLISDRFEGYYSSIAHHPEVKFALKTSDVGKVKLGAGVYWRRYGEDSYAAGGNRPALDYGDRRGDRRGTVDTSYEHRVGTNWSVIAEGKVIVRRTNYPDYVPNVYPANREYDIRWDYENYVASIGVEWHM